MTDPQGSVTTYDYDELNRLTRLTSHLGIFTFGSDDAGRRDSLGYPNGVSVDYGHDAANQLTALHLLSPAMSLLSKYDYAYDAAGNRETRTTLDGDTTYTYDALDRLTGAVGPDPANPILTLTESYAYDAVGNRTSSHLATGQIYDNASRLFEDSNFTYTYDLNGNLVSKQDKVTSALTTYDWDVEDRLVAVHAPAQTVTFKYDALGRRVEVAGSTTTRFVYDQEDIIEQRNGTNALTFRYVHGPGIDEPLAVRDVIAGQTALLHVDGLGSLTAMTSLAGQISATRGYDSYGRVLLGASASGFAFIGREWDADTSLYFHRMRYYDPAIGRYISGDPLGIAGDPASYSYAGDNPSTMVDPLGLLDIEADYLSYLPSSSTIANISAGIGDSLLLGFGDELRASYDQAFGWQGTHAVDRCSTAYKASSIATTVATFAVGAGRMAYAQSAKEMSLAARSAQAAWATREELKMIFRLGLRLAPKFTFEEAMARYGSAEGVIAAAGRTNPIWNAGGLLAVGSAALNAFFNLPECGCK
jgi:RHS repeat-associated protein